MPHLIDARRLLATFNASHDTAMPSLVFAIFSIGADRALDEHAEAFVVRALFIEQRLPFALIDVHPAELIVGDGHPGPEAHRRIAQVSVRSRGT